jgi:tetratricopeptide (TPR) repeat protein
MIVSPSAAIRGAVFGFGSLIAANLFVAPATASTMGEHTVSLSGNFLAGHIAQKRRDLPAAAKFWGKALEQDSDDPNLIRRAFLYAVMNADINRAMELAEKYVSLEQKGPISNLALALRDAKAGEWAKVEDRMSTMDGTGLNSFTKPAMLGWAAYAQSGLEAGLEELKPLRELGGARALHDLHAGLVNELSDKLAAAETYYLSVAEDDAGASLRSARILGTLYERQGKFTEAKAAYELYLQEQPNSQFVEQDLARVAEGGTPPQLIKNPQDGVAEALFGIASSLNRQGGYETSLVLGQLALYIRPEFPVMQYMLGGVLEQLDRYADAIEMYKRLPDDSPFGPTSKIRIANNLDQIEREEEAVEVLLAAAAARPEDPRPKSNLGDVYRRMEKWDKAAEAYDLAVERMGELEPRHWQILYTRGIVMERAKRWERAEADFLKALELYPDQPLVLNYLGYSWVEKGLHLDRALEMIKTAVKKRPHDGYITDSLGWVYYKLGRYEEAVPELERAVELRPEDPIINDHLGDAYWRVGRKLEATFQWNHALISDPEPELREEIEQKLKHGLVDSADAVTKSTTDGG